MAESNWQMISVKEGEACEAQESDSSNSTSACGAKKRAGNYWQRFEKIYCLNSRVNKNLKFECVLCRPKMVCISTAVTSNSNLRKHLKRIHPESLDEFNHLSSTSRGAKRPASVTSPLQPKPSKSLRRDLRSNSTSISRSKFADLILNMASESMLPLSFAEQTPFKALIAACRPELEIPSREFITETLEKKLKACKAAVRNVLANVDFIATTVDCWRTYGRLYLCVTAHWLSHDTFERKSAALACRRISETFDFLNKTISDVYAEYDITKKVTRTITDGGMNCAKAFSVFVPYETDKDVNAVDINDILNKDDSEPVYRRCAIHLLNLVCTVDVSIAEQTLHCLRYKKLSRGVFSKCQALWSKADRYGEVEDDDELKLKCPRDTRWDSVYNAIKQLNNIIQVEGTQALQNICETFNLPRFEEYELEFLALYEVIMSPLATAVKILQDDANSFTGSLLPTIVYLVECLKAKKEKLKENEKIVFLPILDAITSGISERFSDIMSNEKMIASTILLPKFKDTWTDDNKQLQKGIQYIRKRLEESKILSNNDSSANFDDQSTTDFYMKKSKDHALEIYLTSANHDLTIYDEQCASLRNLALELNAPIQTSAICRNMFRSSVGLNSRSQWSNLPDCHYEAFLLNNCNRSFI